MQYKYKRKYHPIGLFYILLINTISTIFATNNFCGESWSTTSANCLSSQPCPLGISSECTTPGQQCWGDTSCDTTQGHGILYNHDDPSHTRFCGISWEDASSNCNVDRHCPSGNDVDCPGSETCYLHLTEDCHYIDLLGGPEQAALTLNGGGSNGSGSANKLNSDHPSRTNYCGYDWNNANECKVDHWCPSGSDSDCPPGKTCFAGTDCKYIHDLVPTITPTNNPSSIPTMSPIKYETIENTSFCANQWDETVNTCRIGSWCPSGDSRDCPSGYKCYTWITGCNILDFQSYYEEHGHEIFGVEHWLLPEGGLPGVEDVVVSSEPGSSSNKVPQLPPAEISSQLGLTSPAEAEVITADESSIPVTSPAENNNVVPQVIRNEPITPQPTPFDPDRYVAANHVFCGQSHTDAAARCSPETFCTDGAATHQCDKVGDYCWAGITTCNAGEWKNRPKTSPPSESISPSEGMVETSRPTPQWSPEPTESPTFDPNSIMGVPDGNYDISSDGSYTVNGNEMRLKQMSFCAIDYNDLMANCATARNCNKWQPCPSGYECYSNVKCLVPMDETWDTSSSIAVATDKPTFPPITMSPIAEPPASWGSPILTNPTTNPPSSSQPTVYTLTEDEIKQRLSYPNNYCSSSLSEVMSSCSYALHTCNSDDRMCPPGTVCFENIQCPNPDETEAPVVSRIETGSPTAGPVHRLTLKPILPPTIQPTAKMSTQPTISPSSVKSVSPQNYCSTSVIEIQSTCTTAQTCNDGEPLCPFGMFCMKNYLCSSDDEEEATTPPTIPSNDKQGNGKAVPQNYCAQWEEELLDICTWTYTCNEGDPPCPTDTFCFDNYVCEGRTTDGETEALATPTVVDTDIDTSTAHALDCSELCLQAIGPSDCKNVQSSVVIKMKKIPPCTESTVSVGHLCKGTGECDTDTELNNCGDGHDIYFRLESSKCIEHGLAVGYGVIPPPETKEEEKEEVSSEIDQDELPNDIVLEDKTTSTSTQAPPLLDDETAIDDESVSDNSSANSDHDWDNWPTDSELESYNDNTENDGLGSWWLMKENRARRGAAGSWKKNMIATLLTGLFLSFMA